MNLRVFRSAEDSLAVEVSSPELQSNFKWLVALLPEDSEDLKGINPSELVRVSFDSKTHFVPFLLINTVRLVDVQVLVGALGLEDSINILNNIYDRLAYDRK